ncbi:hypothetical protein J4470_01560 [Candidatus Woesearchaeota archaeon]|nr:hypothetical protein [Candidatus Woesearchaeota archaeon]
MFISIRECAERLNMDRSHLLKDIKSGKYGHIQLIQRRDRNKQNQKVSTISIEDFETIKKAREIEGYTADGTVIKELKGVFYIVQTNPDTIPHRYKFGFSKDLRNRLDSYKSVCPNLKLIAKYDCDSIHELPLLKMVSRYGKRIGQELYEIQNVAIVKEEIEEVLKKLLPERTS